MGRKRFWSISGIAAVAALIVATIAPPSGWIVRQQFLWTAAMLLPMRAVKALAPAMGDNDKALEAAAARHPDDLGMQIAQAMMNPDKLMALRARFPRRPALDAALLIALSKDRLKLDNRDGDQAQLQWPNPSTAQNQASKAPTSETLATWDTAAIDGEGCDPTNAFFPMMRAVELYAAGRDDEACNAFQCASALPRYDDYDTDSVRGKWRLADTANGMESGSLPKMAIRAGELFPHYQRLRAAARLAIVHAITLEKAGKAEEGFAVRRAVARSGDRMRADSPWVIGNLCGAALSAIVRLRPSGAPEFPQEKGNSTARGIKITQAYEAYLRQIGHSEEIVWIEHEDAASATIKSVTKKGLDSGPGSLPVIILLAAFWAMAAFVLTSALLILLLGGVAAGLSRTTTVRAAQPLKPLATLGIFALAMGVIVYLAQATFGLAGMMNGGGAAPSADAPGATVSRLFLSLLLCAVPIAMTISFAVQSRKQAIPASTGIAQGFVRRALPTATGFLLVFAAMVAILTVGEAHELRDLSALTNSEGKTFAADQHKAWPPFAPTPQP